VALTALLNCIVACLFQERRETKEERERRHAAKAAHVQQHRSLVTGILSQRRTNQTLRGKTSFHCPLKFDNR
jgi:hypothetical protein